MRPNQDLDEVSTEYQRYLADVRGLLIHALNNGRSYESIAVPAFVGVTTLKRFVDGTTKKPTLWTLDRTLMVLGYRNAIVPIETPILPGEVKA